METSLEVMFGMTWWWGRGRRLGVIQDLLLCSVLREVK